MQKIWLVIPCYNESERLPVEVLKAFGRDNPHLHWVMVDDGSRDNTIAVLKAFKDALPENVQVLVQAKNGGKSEAVRRGVLHILSQSTDLDFIGYWDADLSTPLSEIHRFHRVLESRKDVFFVSGARIKLLGKDIKRKASRHYLGRVFASCASIVLGLPVYDTQCGAKLFRANDVMRSVFQEPFLSRWIFDVEIFARIIVATKSAPRNPGFEMQGVFYELPLEKWEDVGGSKLKPQDFIKAFRDLIRIHRAIHAESQSSPPS